MSVEKRIIAYTLTIHKEDIDTNGNNIFNCDTLKKYCSDVFNLSSEVYFIDHNEEDVEEHIHLVCRFKFNAGKTFSRMKSLFPKSHIEEALDIQNAILYLTHESKNAIEENKHKYEREKVVNVFGTDIDRYYNTPQIEVFDYNKIEEYILVDGCSSILDFGRRFGYDVIAPKWKIIQEIKLQLSWEKNDNLQVDYSTGECIGGVPLDLVKDYISKGSIKEISDKELPFV